MRMRYAIAIVLLIRGARSRESNFLHLQNRYDERRYEKK